VDSLIKSGAFESLGHSRKGLSQVAEEIIDHVLTLRRDHDLGISTLFSVLEENSSDVSNFNEARREIDDVEFDKSELLAMEKEMLGLYVSDHPLLGVEAVLRRKTDATIASLLIRPRSIRRDSHPASRLSSWSEGL